MMTEVQENRLISDLVGPIQRWYDATRIAEKTWSAKDLEQHDTAMKMLTEARKAYRDFIEDAERELR